MVDQALWEQLKSSVVGVRSTGGTGTGFIATPSGLIVTNVHVVGYDHSVVVRLKTGHEELAKVVYANTRLDTAFLAPVRRLGRPMQLADSSAAQEGMSVMAIGHPLALDFTITRGIISATRRRLPEDMTRTEYLQTDAAINPGNSGGPLLDAHGRVLGINTMVYDNSTNLGFAVPVHCFRADLDRLAAMTLEEVRTQKVFYHCVECGVPHAPTRSRCLKCGAATRYGAGLGMLLTSEEEARAQQVVIQILQRLGYVPGQLYAGPQAWRLTVSDGLEVWIEIGPKGRYIGCAARLVKVPDHDHESFFRFLLTVNDQETGDCRLSVANGMVSLGFAVSTAFLRAEKMRSSLERLMDLSAAIAETLREGWGCQAAPRRFSKRELES